MHLWVKKGVILMAKFLSLVTQSALNYTFQEPPTKHFSQWRPSDSPSERWVAPALAIPNPTHSSATWKTHFSISSVAGYLISFSTPSLCTNSFCLVLWKKVKANKKGRFTFLRMNCDGASNNLVVIPAVDTCLWIRLFSCTYALNFRLQYSNSMNLEIITLNTIPLTKLC